MRKARQLFLATLFLSAVQLSASKKDFQAGVASFLRQGANATTVAVAQKEDLFVTASPCVGPETQFYLGSVSKHMTAYMLLQSLRTKFPKDNLERLLKMKLKDLFPHAAFLKKMNQPWTQQIGLLDLLTHRSGLGDYLEPYDRKGRLDKALEKPLDGAALLRACTYNPKQGYLYTNANYLLVGKLIEEITGQGFDVVFKRVIQGPAGLSASHAPTTGTYTELKKTCCPHLSPDLNGEEGALFINMANAVGAGNVISTEADLMKWGHYLFKKAPTEIRDIMLKDYGKDTDGDRINLGLGTEETDQLGPLIGHQGNLDSFWCFFGYAPQADTLIVMLSNNKTETRQALMEKLGAWLEEPKGAGTSETS